MALSRVGKTLLVAVVALDMGLVALDNVLDYDANYEFVQHVLRMDDVFPNNPLRGRALAEPVWHRAFYAAIIGWEALVALLAGFGALRMAWAWRADAAAWGRARGWAEAALVAALLLWYLAFLVVGGEWFQMWQSKTWNGQAAAFRMFAVQGLVLLYLRQPDGDRPGAPGHG